MPTVGLTETSKILDIDNRRDRDGIRIYTFGVGDDVDAHLLDLLAEATRGCSTYVRPTDDLEATVSAFSTKIQRPLRTDLELEISGAPRLFEMYPPRLPDLFQGEQLQVLGRHEGHGPAALTLKGHAGDQVFKEVFKTTFPEMAAEHDFIAPIWARRKVGYLLDQVRLNGESAEVKNELIHLARDFSIATPYTSLLVVPDSSASAGVSRRPTGLQRRRFAPRSMPLAAGFGAGVGAMGGMATGGSRMTGPSLGMAGMGGLGGRGGGMGGMGGGMGGMGGGMGGMGGGIGGIGVGPMDRRVAPGSERARARGHDPANAAANSGAASAPLTGVPSSGKEAIDLAQRVAELKSGARSGTSPNERTVAGRRFRKVGETWVDQTFKPSMPTLRLRALGKAYFRLLARHPDLSPILALGNRVTWVSFTGRALVIDKQGQDDVTDATLDRLFAELK